MSLYKFGDGQTDGQVENNAPPACSLAIKKLILLGARWIYGDVL